MSLRFRQSFDDRIEIESGGGAPVACYRFGRELPKPCFHPLVTAKGRHITGFQMSDHVWHRGLWYTIKFINKTNFWEEHPPFGIQRTVAQPSMMFVAADTLRIGHRLRWESEATGAVIDEDRTVELTLLPDGTRRIDWQTSLAALDNLVLDRTPYTTWGGYGGMTFRAAREVHKTSYLLPDGKNVSALIGEPHPWAILRGVVDGDTDGKISVGMIDHPGNPRSPQVWYAKSGNSYDFMNAAFLFHEPMTVARGERLQFRYRILFGDGWWEAADFGRLADDFVRPGS